MGSSEVDDEVYTLPLYTMAEAARILGMSRSTAHGWFAGYKKHGGRGRQNAAVATQWGEFGLSVSFDGIAEVYVLTRLREAGVPMQKIRPAVEQLKAEMGIDRALLSDKLKTDGAVVLYEYLYEDIDESDPDAASDTVLLEVTSKQAVFKDAIAQYLSTISYAATGDRINAITLAQYNGQVSINPRVNAGQPTLTQYGVKILDITGRYEIGEPLADVADDFEIPLAVAQVLVDA
jgi:uncharacterized protein (DUF433 family)